MAASILNQLIDSVNYLDYGYNNVSKAKTCVGTASNGKPCGKRLLIIVK
jgi:hypothetical protein